ncbi:MAG: hypothetical protein ABI321_15040 [Polyangia bacterium]
MGADEPRDPDTEIAQRHFRLGARHYEESQYALAIVEFEAARRTKAFPELDYDIARCHDRMEQPQAAVDAYERFLRAQPNAPQAQEVTERIRVLRERLTADVDARRYRRRYVASAAVGGAAVVLAAIGAGLAGSVSNDLSNLKADWLASPTHELQDRGHALEARANAGYALLGVAGAVAVVDIALWIVAARRHR